MRFTFVTLFPELVKSYFLDSILYRAIQDEKISVDFVNPRDFTQSKHNKVDDAKIGGGAGMLIDLPTFHNTLLSLNHSKTYIIIPQPAAKRFVNSDAKRLALKKHIVFICGRYEGIDERVIENYADEVLSIGDFILTGGELASLCMCDAISRHIGGVLGNQNSLDEESFENGLLEAPSFTKPNVFEDTKVPSLFLSGNHKKVDEIKYQMSLEKTKFHRPDLFRKSNIL